MLARAKISNCCLKMWGVCCKAWERSYVSGLLRLLGHLGAKRVPKTLHNSTVSIPRETLLHIGFDFRLVLRFFRAHLAMEQSGSKWQCLCARNALDRINPC
jgi:hypothetical protein